MSALSETHGFLAKLSFYLGQFNFSVHYSSSLHKCGAGHIVLAFVVRQVQVPIQKEMHMCSQQITALNEPNSKTSTISHASSF